MCRQCAANIFIQHPEEQGTCQAAHAPAGRQTAQPAHGSAEHTRRQFAHLTRISDANTSGSNLNNEFSPRRPL